MQLINAVSLQIAQQLFVAAGRFRTGISLIGARNGSNITYTLPGGERFLHNLPYSTIHIFCNGQRLGLLDDYTIVESRGGGTGYDTVLLEYPPIFRDKLLVDYIAIENT